MSSGTSECWACGSDDVGLVKKANYTEISASDFRITDANYGVTADIFQCRQCEFLFCPNLPDLIPYYQSMEDAEYERTRKQRSIQLRNLLERISPTGGSGTTLLDIGSGSGILVEEAIKLGFLAEGIEPSESLSKRSLELGLPVINDQFPSDKITKRYDVITLIDIIEHVTNPRAVISATRERLSPNGVCSIVTPDVGSFVARLMGWRWWHFRLAHVAYFNKDTLCKLLESCGLDVVSIQKPAWYFPADYLFERTMLYFPKSMHMEAPAFLNRITIPLNLRDSFMVICRAKDK